MMNTRFIDREFVLNQNFGKSENKSFEAIRSISRKSVYECVRDPDLIRDDTSNKMKFVTSFYDEMGPSFRNKNCLIYYTIWFSQQYNCTNL